MDPTGMKRTQKYSTMSSFYQLETQSGKIRGQRGWLIGPCGCEDAVT
jgi:hypothetical protein